MKIAAHFLSPVLSDMKAEDIDVQLLFITLFYKVVGIVLAASLSHAIKAFTYQHERPHGQVTARISLCH
jgi:hypothetical protein